MKHTGMTRPIDELGRIVIPKEIRNALDLNPKDELEIYIENGRIILTKVEEGCAICGSLYDLREVEEKKICSACAEKIRETI